MFYIRVFLGIVSSKLNSKGRVIETNRSLLDKALADCSFSLRPPGDHSNGGNYDNIVDSPTRANSRLNRDLVDDRNQSYGDLENFHSQPQAKKIRCNENNGDGMQMLVNNNQVGISLYGIVRMLLLFICFRILWIKLCRS